MRENENSPEKQGPCAREDQSLLLQPAVADVGCVWRILTDKNCKPILSSCSRGKSGTDQNGACLHMYGSPMLQSS